MTGTRNYDMITIESLETGSYRGRNRVGAPIRHAAAPEEKPVGVCEFSDPELGAMVRMACGLDGERCDAYDIAMELSLEDGKSVGRMLEMIYRKLGLRIRKMPAGNAGAGRPSRVTAEQVMEIHNLRGSGLTMPQIVERTGISMGCVRYVLTRT